MNILIQILVFFIKWSIVGYYLPGIVYRSIKYRWQDKQLSNCNESEHCGRYAGDVLDCYEQYARDAKEIKDAYPLPDGTEFINSYVDNCYGQTTQIDSYAKLTTVD